MKPRPWRQIIQVGLFLQVKQSQKRIFGERGPKAVCLLTFPVLDLQDWFQLAWGNTSGHLAGYLCLALLTGYVERCVAIAVLQLQASPFLHQLAHHVRQV